ncbi:MAG: acetoacetyl-CoA synthetase, partial [Solirubrobacteraceae bacterium]|nr:acetoacetyl-CoA synthetase [Solirubrobacteraceae bacterium]
MAVTGELLWTPGEEVRRTSQIGRYLDWLARERGVALGGYDELFRWSVDDLEGFWASIWDFFGVRAHTPYERVLSSREMPGARFFPGSTLNYAEHMLGLDEDTGRTAVLAHSQ